MKGIKFLMSFMLFPFYFFEADGWFTSKFSHRNLSIGDADQNEYWRK